MPETKAETKADCQYCGGECTIAIVRCRNTKCKADHAAVTHADPPCFLYALARLAGDDDGFVRANVRLQVEQAAVTNG